MMFWKWWNPTSATGRIRRARDGHLVSLADIVESASRSMGRVSCEEMQKKVDELLKQRVVDGHLDDSGLTFGDLKKSGTVLFKR